MHAPTLSNFHWIRLPGYDDPAPHDRPHLASNLVQVYPVPRRDSRIHWGLNELVSVMEKEKQVRKRVLLRTLGNPIVLIPFMAGITAMTAALAMGTRVSIGLFAGVAGTLAGAGTFLTRLLLKGDCLSREILGEIEAEEKLKHQEALNALDRTLTQADDDPRPEAALRDLRALVKGFDELEARSGSALIHSMVQIRSRVDQMFRQCVQSLEQTDRLWQTAENLQTESARQPLLKQRETLITDVQDTVKQLSNTLVNLQSLSIGGNPSAELQQLREELDQSLEVARNVEARVHSLLRETGSPRLDASFSPDSKLKG
jgi:ElaB/YqjD/DUF883 family membrane-anchored ribosome-binding protein